MKVRNSILYQSVLDTSLVKEQGFVKRFSRFNLSGPALKSIHLRGSTGSVGHELLPA